MLLVVKASFRCNATCTYCASARGDDTDMSPEVAVLLVNRAAEAARTLGRPVSLLWHGGEPLLLGAAFFRHVRAAAERVGASGGPGLCHRVQTNLTLLDAPLVAALRDLGVRDIGTSFDPFSRQRRLRDGSDYQAAWRRGIDVAMKAGLRISAVLTLAPSRLREASRLHRYWRNLMGPAADLRVNPVHPLGRARHSPPNVRDAEAWGAMLRAFVEAWEEDGRAGAVHPVTDWMAALEGGRPRLACDCGRCPGEILGVDPSGDVYQCGRALDAGMAPLGSLRNARLVDLLESPGRRQFIERRERLAASACAGCRWFDLCGGGCAALAWVGHGRVDAPDPWCRGRKMLFEWMAAGRG